MNNYRISIIIPIYNVELYINECLHSVAAQSITEGLECILVDDCGTDNSMEIAEQFVAKYKGCVDFQILRHEYNRGLSAARNTGVQSAKGEYIFFLDSDDTITPDCMELMWGLIEKYGKVDLVKGSFYKTEEEKATLSEYNISEYVTSQATIKSFLLDYVGDVVAAANKLVGKAFIQKYNLYFKEGIIHEDNYWSFFLAKYVTSMCFCGKRTYFHRYNPNSITRCVNVAKECFAYKIIIKDLSGSIDPFLPGIQKEYVLNNLITALDCAYFISDKGKAELITDVRCTYTPLEKILFYLYLKIRNSFIKSKILHLLIRVFKTQHILQK